MAESALSFKIEDDLKELVHLIRSIKDRGGFFLVGVSGPAAKKTLKNELASRLKGDFVIKKIKWQPGTTDLAGLFPPNDPANTVYIVEEMEKSLQEDDSAVYALLNLTREFYVKNKKIVIYQLPPDTVYKGVQWKAADFWSFRTASFDLFLEEDYQAMLKEKVAAELAGHEKASERVAFFEKLLAKAKRAKNPDRRQISTLLATLGNLYIDLGETRKALTYHQQSLELDRQLGNKQGEAVSLGSIGLVYHDLGRSKKALKDHQKALALAGQQGNKQAETAALGNIGRVYLDLGQPQEALEYLKQSLDLAGQLGNKEAEAAALGSIGRVYFDLGHRKKALTYFQQALELAGQLGNKYGEAAVLGNIGMIYRDLGKFREAVKHHLHALELNRQLGDRQEEAVDLANIALDYLHIGQDQKAVAYLENALDIFKRIGNKREEKKILEEIKKIKDRGAKEK